MSVIEADEDHTQHFLDDYLDNTNNLFGTGNIGPDRIRLSVANSIYLKAPSQLSQPRLNL